MWIKQTFLQSHYHLESKFVLTHFDVSSFVFIHVSMYETTKAESSAADALA